ncbi:MAG: hypothetical protein ISR95_09640 [Candidatus Marinimicrobia bacterium]|nr:hypothetical protein [Candidatus Neomarinimicrobiota bacterium]
MYSEKYPHQAFLRLFLLAWIIRHPVEIVRSSHFTGQAEEREDSETRRGIDNSALTVIGKYEIVIKKSFILFLCPEVSGLINTLCLRGLAVGSGRTRLTGRPTPSLLVADEL